MIMVWDYQAIEYRNKEYTLGGVQNLWTGGPGQDFILVKNWSLHFEMGSFWV